MCFQHSKTTIRMEYGRITVKFKSLTEPLDEKKTIYSSHPQQRKREGSQYSPGVAMGLDALRLQSTALVTLPSQGAPPNLAAGAEQDRSKGMMRSPQLPLQGESWTHSLQPPSTSRKQKRSSHSGRVIFYSLYYT